jgi:hypothetical protein
VQRRERERKRCRERGVEEKKRCREEKEEGLTNIKYRKLQCESRQHLSLSLSLSLSKLPNTPYF